MKRIAVLAFVVGCSDEPAAPVHPLAVASVEDLGKFPLPPHAVGRDGGGAGMLDGKMLWLFGDTFLDAKNPIDMSQVFSATGGWSTPNDPFALVEPVDSSGFGAQIIPYTAEELAKNQMDAFNGWALWPGVMIDGMIVFQRIQRIDGMGYESRGIGTARIAVDATVATRAPADLFAEPDLFAPQFRIDEYVYALHCKEVGFLNQGCAIARAPHDRADQRDAYEFFDGTAYTTDIASAATAFEHVAGAPSISYNAYLGRYLMVTAKLLDSTAILRTAEHVEGPWSETVEIAPADGGILAPPHDGFNYVYLEHPELASSDGRSIVISYSRPTEPFQGDVRLTRITLD